MVLLFPSKPEFMDHLITNSLTAQYGLDQNPTADYKLQYYLFSWIKWLSIYMALWNLKMNNEVSLWHFTIVVGGMKIIFFTVT